MSQTQSKRTNWTRIRKAAEKGDAAAQYKYAWKFESDDDDDEQAIYWLRKAAEQGHALAYYRWAFLQKDPIQRIVLLTRGAELGSVHCQNDLGISYWQGQGCPKDDVRGTEWILKAAAQGHDGAESLLYQAYRDGRGVKADQAKAVDYLRRSCEHGNGYVMPLLAGLLADGKEGVKPDLVEAYMWLSLGMPDRGDRDYPQYKKDLDALAHRMTRAQIAAAKRRARKWRPKPPTGLSWNALYYADPAYGDVLWRSADV